MTINSLLTSTSTYNLSLTPVVLVDKAPAELPCE
jgi:hypothetical protein